MKLTNTRSIKSAKGMTLLELTVVILVLLSLISILFVGAKAWKKGSDRAANIMNIRNVQQAVRGHQNMHNMAETVALTDDLIVGANGYLKAPVTPNITAISEYKYLETVPAIGALYLLPQYTATGADYAPGAETDISQW
jgi:type II secretory pathway pseudopilin PulG